MTLELEDEVGREFLIEVEPAGTYITVCNAAECIHFEPTPDDLRELHHFLTLLIDHALI